jgi:hypothetical protein
MTFGIYAKRQTLFEPELNTPFLISYFKPEFSAVLKNIRLRYLISNNFTDDCTIKLQVYSNNDELIEESNSLTLNQFTMPIAKQFRQGWIRFDFSSQKTITIDNQYKLKMVYTCTSYNSSNSRFLLFAIDYPFNTNQVIGLNDPFENCRIEWQLFTERLYDDFVVR